jgi:hypothetical protein
MLRLLLFSLLTGLVPMTEPIRLSAQERSYDKDALRLDSRIGDIRILRGVEGTVVGMIGVFRGQDLSAVVQASGNAVAEARTFQRDYRPGNLILGLGLMTFGAALGVSRISDVNPGISTGLFVASVGFIGYGGFKLQSAYNALHRALWWYNRDLPR